ncbi:septum formation inhibitor Maf [Gillisia sp. M10.2A]|uniref:Septum formation inhibitor Maf n=1 Tax=Gillisia lutea TaxID=2909668 RepID=A0ABS9EHZ0_9FLAO|nr:septum formation inhibitor Maf [Gillisia lutea]MCF4101459.1 septum formation inhibitor Maf [Gillisia lutea]
MKNKLLLSILITFQLLTSCNGPASKKSPIPRIELSQDFKNYWFSGEAEITSYQLNQSRYGENRTGTAVLIYVTEDFLKDQQVKASGINKSNIPVIKLNSTKKFTTGIYPYSIMQSVFSPLEGNSHAIKTSTSVQEWCGHAYTQINNRNEFEVSSHSYFENEADQGFSLAPSYLENEIWTLLKIDPNLLPTGEIQMIPSLESIRLNHFQIKAYLTEAEFYQDGKLGVYKLYYPELKRSLSIYYQTSFPFKIEKWEEILEKNGKKELTIATKMADIKTAYWTKNSNIDLPLRKKLNLD